MEVEGVLARERGALIWKEEGEVAGVETVEEVPMLWRWKRIEELVLGRVGRGRARVQSTGESSRSSSSTRLPFVSAQLRAASGSSLERLIPSLSSTDPPGVFFDTFVFQTLHSLGRSATSSFG